MALEAWGCMDWLMDDSVQPGAGLSLARMSVNPGQTSPAHRHPNCNEAIHLIEGVVDVRVDSAWTTLTAFVPARSVHQVRNAAGRTAIMMIAYSAGARVYEEVED